MAYYYTRDHLGSVREMTNSSGTIVARYDYDMYGKTTLVSGSNLSTRQYAGMFTHQPSGLNLTWFRAFDPNSGRWLSRDPLEEHISLNFYKYCKNDPVLLTDPLGLCPCSDPITSIVANSVLGSVLTVGQVGPRITAAAWGLAGLIGSAYDYLNGGNATPPGATGPADAGAEGVENVTGQEGIATPLSVLGAFNEQISQVGENANEVANQEAELTNQLIDNNVDILDNCF